MISLINNPVIKKTDRTHVTAAVGFFYFLMAATENRRNLESLYNFADDAGADSTAAFTDGKAKPLFHGYRRDQLTGDMDIVAGKLITPIAMEEGLRFAIREGGRTVGAGVISEIIE